MASPRSGDTIAKDWIMVDLLHIVSAEPDDNGRPQRRRKPSRNK